MATASGTSLATVTFLLVAVTGLAACNIEELTPTSQVVRNRVAGIRAEPAEITIGGSTTLDALLVHPGPEAPDLGQIWFACVEGGDATGCLGTDFDGLGEVDPEDPGGFDPSELAFGIGETFEFHATGAQVEEAWEALEPADRVEGLTVLISVAFVEPNNEELTDLLIQLAQAAQSGDTEAMEAASSEFQGLFEGALLGARRIIISDKNAGEPDPVACGVDELLPNDNPELGTVLFHLDVDGRDSGIELDASTSAEAGSTLILRPQLSAESIEDYLYISREGITECRTEAPFFAWLSNGGEGQSHSGDYSFIADEGDLDEEAGRPKIHRLTLPEADNFTDPIDLWLVVRDRRGGIDWRHWSVAPGDGLPGNRQGL